MFKKAKWAYVLLSVALTVLGLCLIIWPTVSAKTLCCAAGILLLVFGVIRLIAYFSDRSVTSLFRADLAGGIIFTVMGAIMLVRSSAIIAVLPVLIGLFVLVDSIFKLQTAIDARRIGLSSWWLLLAEALVCAVLSVLVILNPFAGADVLMIMVGISLLAGGIENFSNLYYLSRLTREAQIEE